MVLDEVMAKIFQSKAERDEILNQIAVAEQQCEKYDALDDDDKWDWHYQEGKRLRTEYNERLPEITLSICPFCSKPFTVPMDSFGYDGPWWGTRPAPENVCEHFTVIREAVNFNGLRLDLGSLGGSGRTFGPEVPYVIKRLFNFPTMICVMSHVHLDCGYDYYPM